MFWHSGCIGGVANEELELSSQSLRLTRNKLINMKRTIITAISAVAAISSLNAAVDVTTAYTTDYYFRGFQLADSIIEAAVDYSEGDFYLGAWTAQPFDAAGDDSIYQNELDIYGGMGFALSDTISMDVGLCAYIYPELSDGDTATYEPYVGIAFDAALAPSFYVYYDVTLEALTLEGSIGHSIEIDETSTLDFGLSVGSISPNEGDSAIYYGASVGYGLSIGETASFSASLGYQDGDDAIVGGNWDDGFYASVGLSVGF